MIQIGVVMDPIHTIKPYKDSTLAMLLAAQKRGWQISYMEQRDLGIEDGEIWARTRPLTVRDDTSDWFTLGEEAVIPARELPLILMRKDPPFDMEYVYMTYLLEQVEQRGTLVVNRPGSVRDCNEKLFATWFPDCTPPHVVSRDPAYLNAFLAAEGEVVFKPLDGMGGSSIFRVREGDPNLNVILELLTDHGRRQIMGQKYIPEISAGDTRILLIDGEPVPYGLARIPKEGESRGNLAAGGTGVGRELSDNDRRICARVGPALVERGLTFVGIDVIGPYLTEINVTCPTCIRELDSAFELDIAGTLMDCLEEKLAVVGREAVG